MRILPAIALRGMTVLPGMGIHFDINRSKSVEAARKAMKQGGQVFLVAQRNGDVALPEEGDLCHYGTIGTIKQMVNMPTDVTRVVVEGETRAALLRVLRDTPYFEVEVEEEPFQVPEEDTEIKGMGRLLQDLLKRYINGGLQASAELKRLATQEVPVEVMIREIMNLLPLSQGAKQAYLEESEGYARYYGVLRLLTDEAEIQEFKHQFQNEIKSRIDQNQKDYILREQMKLIREELGEDNIDSDAEAFRKKLERLQVDDEVRKKLEKEIKRFAGMPSGSQEGAVLRTYLETVFDMPWNAATTDSEDIRLAKAILDEDHYGLEKVKERILEYLAVRTLTGHAASPILCLVGPPGTGKTSIARSVARALQKKYVRLSLGGVHDEAEIRGHRKTYVGAMPGRIATAIRQVGVNNPLMLLDEIDKLGSDMRGDPSSAMLEVLDSEQNSHFRDHYLEVPFDLSHVLFMATANDPGTIPGPLLDRMEIINISGYTANEKFHIAKNYLLPKQLKMHGLTNKQLKLEDEVLKSLIDGYTREAGVRNLERRIGQLCRKAACQILEKKRKRVYITGENLAEYLGKAPYSIDPANEEDQVGIVRGLAWTRVGGDTLEIEVNSIPGKGELKLTGQLGNVMRESALIALGYIRSVASQYQILEDYFDKHELHIHIPQGAVPKDGPSAGITMATAMFSAITNQKVPASWAMTGEITLRGRILPIGGLKEKLLAAKTAGIKTVMVPEKNEGDVLEISKEITEGLEIRYVQNMTEILKMLKEAQEGITDDH